MDFDPDSYLATPSTGSGQGPAQPVSDFDPDQYLAAPDDSARNDAPAAAPAAPAFDPDAYLQANGGKVKQAGKAFARGATAEGIYAAIEGGAHLVDQVDRSADIERAKGPEYTGLARSLGELQRSEQLGPNATRQSQIKRIQGRMDELTAAAAPEIERLQARGPDETALGSYANATAALRQQIREALPIDQEFAQSKLGQISQGIGQAVGTLPMYAVPGLGPAVGVGQIYDEAYQDAKQSGADDATAHNAAMKYLPAASLDYLADKLVVGKILKPLKGKMSVGHVLKDILVTAAAEGGTEGAQQLYLNSIAKKLEGYDPDRPFDKEVFDSVLVGAVVGGVATGTGQAATAAASRGAAGRPAASRDQGAVADFNEKLAEIPGGPTETNLPTPAATPAEGSPAGAPAGSDSTAAPADAAIVVPPGTPPSPAPQLEAFTPNPDLDEHARSIETRFAEQLQADPAAAYETYKQANTKNGALVIDVDQIRELSPDYSATPESRNKLSPAVHEPASAFSKYVLARAIEEQPPGAVLFLAGGGGSGKSMAVSRLPEISQGASIIVDSTLANPESAARRIDQARAAGRPVRIAYTYADAPVAWKRAESRRVAKGRSVPFPAFAEAHTNALASVIKLQERYFDDPGVEIKFVDNSGGEADLKAVSRDAIFKKLIATAQLSETEAKRITQEVENVSSTQPNERSGSGQNPGRVAEDRAATGRAGRGAPEGGRPVGAGVGEVEPGSGRGDEAGPAGQDSDALTSGGEIPQHPIREFPIDKIAVNRDVKQFKADADPTSGVVEPLGGKYERLGTGPILLWQKTDGTHEVITGRHRLDLAKRSGEKTIPAQVVRQADGWTKERAMTADAESNIRGGQGSVKDYAQYFRAAADLSTDEAAARGLTGRAKGAAGWALGRQSTPALWDLYANGQLGEGKAVAIARGAPAHAAAQASALRLAKGKTAPELELYARNLARSSDRAGSAEQLGFDGVAQDFADFEREAAAVAKIQAERISANRQLIEAAAGAAKRPEAARKMGLPVNNPEQLQQRVEQLRAENERLQNPDEAAYQELRKAAGLPTLERVAPATEEPAPPAADDPAQVGMFARRKAPAPGPDQTDLFAGGETGGDTTFSLAGGEATDFTGVVDEQAAAAEARREAAAAQTTLFSRRTPAELESDRAELEQARQRWRLEAERIAPGVMKRFALQFGDPEQLVAAGKVRPSEITGWEQAFYDGHERLLYLFDQALQKNTENFTRLNLLHEMGHAHWDTLPRDRQAELAAEWRKETGEGKGPLYDGKGKLRPGVATGIETDIKEWYAERVAWANHDWARKRAAGQDVRNAGAVDRAAQQLRILLAKLQEWVGQLRGQPVDVDFRRFLDQGNRFEDQGAGSFTRRDDSGDGLTSDREMPKRTERSLKSARINLEQTRRFGTPEAIAKDEKTVRDAEQEAEYWQKWEAARKSGQGQLFARRAPGAAHSARNVSDRMRDAGENVRSWLRTELTSRGHMPAEVFDSKLAKDGRVAAVEKRVQFALRDLDAAVRAVHGGWGAITPAAQQQINEVLGGRVALSTLDPRLQPAVGAMRQHVDELSRRLVREGVVGGNLAGKIAGNLGFYLNRSYRKFDDPKWAEKVPPAVLNRASSFIRAEMRDEILDTLADQQYRAANPNLLGQPTLDRNDPAWVGLRAQLATNQAIQPDEAKVQGYVEYLLTKDTGGVAEMFQQSGAEGRKDLSIFTKRKEIPPELRALLGEYEDPRINYARSVAKTAQVLESHRFLVEARKAGLGRFFHEEPMPGYTTQIAAEGSKALAPLNGLYTSPEIAEAFHRTLDEKAPQNPAWRAFLALNGWVKTAKTILHPVTQVRNFVANLGFLVANGHWHGADGGKAVLQAMKADFTKGDAQSRAYLQRLAQLGVVGESTSAGEIREALNNAGVKLSGVEEWTDHVATKAAKLPFKAAARLYQLNDEVFKVFAYQNEVNHWKKAMPSAPLEQVEQIAAERVRNTLPTYSQVPRLVQRIRQAALLGSFVSFPSEIVRTGYHTLRYAMTDLKSNNPEVRAMGARRLAGMSIAAGIMPAAAAVSRWLNDVDDEDEKDLRRFLPDWNKNAQLLYTKPGRAGQYSVVDLSYLDPWAYLRKPVAAAMRGDNWADSIGDAANEAAAPFFQEGVLAKVLLDVARNVDDQGRPVYDVQAGPIDRQLQKVAHVWTAAEPGFVTQAKRIAKAARGEVGASGRAYNLQDELTALLTGARSTSVNVAQAHSFKAGQFDGQLGQASTLYRRERDRQGTVDPADVAAAREKLEATRAKLYEQIIQDTAAAGRLGVDPGTVLVNLLAANLSKYEAAAVLGGQVLPYRESPPDKMELVRRQMAADAATR